MNRKASTLSLVVGFLAFTVSSSALASIPPRTELTNRYPNVMKFLNDVTLESGTIDPGIATLMRSKRAHRPTTQQWDQFLKTSISDGLTNLRAFALLGMEAKKRGISLWGPGEDYERAVNRNKINLGLSLPAAHIIVGMWEVPEDQSDPELLLHIKIIYDKPYVHEFPDEIMPANLKVGTGEPVHFTLAGQSRVGYPMEADLFYGNGKLGWKNIKGVSGHKRGFLGVMQKILFFVPDAIHSMIIDDRSGSMLTEAIINTTVNDFEKRPIYRIHYDQ